LAAVSSQIIWQPGWTQQCAKTLGEEAEQFFAYWAKFAFTTRNQSLAGGWVGGKQASHFECLQ
jgi:hypothetical protein